VGGVQLMLLQPFFAALPSHWIQKLEAPAAPMLVVESQASAPQTTVHA
jgi:hypothetical protein